MLLRCFSDGNDVLHYIYLTATDTITFHIYILRKQYKA